MFRWKRRKQSHSLEEIFAVAAQLGCRNHHLLCVLIWKVRSKVVKYITASHYCVNSQTEKQSIACNQLYTCTKQSWACWFYSLSGDTRQVGRMCSSLTGKWHTVISELQPTLFLSSLFLKARCCKRQQTKAEENLQLFHFLKTSHIYYLCYQSEFDQIIIQSFTSVI